MRQAGRRQDSVEGGVEDEYALGGWLDPGGGDGGTRILVAGLARLTRDDLAP